MTTTSSQLERLDLTPTYQKRINRFHHRKQSLEHLTGQLNSSSNHSRQHRVVSSLHDADDRTVGSWRSIGGRLGGHIAVPLFLSSRDCPGDDIVVDETSKLLQEPSSPLGSPVRDGHRLTPAPKLSKWILPALACATAYAFYNIFIKKGSATISPILGGVVLQFVAALLGSMLLGVCAFRKENKDATLHYDKEGIQWSVCAGISVGLAEMLSFCVSGMGVQATQFIPVVIGGSVMFGAIMGFVFLDEKLQISGWFGVGLLVFGIYMVVSENSTVLQDEVLVVTTGPPVLVWIFPALACAGAYALYSIFIKKGSASINPILGGVILQIVAALFGAMLLAGIVLIRGGTQSIGFEFSGFVCACMAGISVGLAEMMSFGVNGMGVQATQSIPVIIGGSVMFSAVLGLWMLGETMKFQGWSGVVLLMLGIVFVATDPGEEEPEPPPAKVVPLSEKA